MSRRKIVRRGQSVLIGILAAVAGPAPAPRPFEFPKDRASWDELQAQDDPGVADRYSSGSLYRHAAPAANSTTPPGQWNRYTVRARGLRIEVWSKGQQVLDTTLGRHADTLPDPPLRGYLGLQNHGAPAEYRNIRLQKLGP